MIGLMIIGLPFQSSAQNKNDGFVSIFDGKSLNGWEGDSQYWRVENGNIVGEITPDRLLKTNTFLIWRGGEPEDFELKLEYRISKTGNSGINYRSEQITEVPFALRGYQADIDGMNRYTGQNYEERGRTTLAYRGQKTKIIGTDDPNASLKDHVKNNAWTKLEVTKSLGDKDALQNTVNIGSILKAENPTVKGVKFKSGGKKEVETTKASRVERIKVSFVMGENKIAKQGVKPVYVRLMSPDGKEICKSADEGNMVKFNGSKGYYAAKQDINYKNEEVAVEVLCASPSGFLPGKYLIDIICDDVIVGQTSIMLK